MNVRDIKRISVKTFSPSRNLATFKVAKDLKKLIQDLGVRIMEHNIISNYKCLSLQKSCYVQVHQ